MCAKGGILCIEIFCSCLWGMKRHSVKLNQYLFLFIQKVHLELEGHTAVQPSEFLHGDDGSPLIVVLRNEDIVEHICEVIVSLIIKLTAKELQQTLSFVLVFFFSITGPKFAHAEEVAWCAFCWH